MRSFVESVVAWPRRRWAFAAATAVGGFVLAALSTDIIPNPVFGRDVPPTWWSTPALAASSITAGMLAATYVASPLNEGPRVHGRLGAIGSMASFFAVGCPVCNKLVLVALGYSGALRYFAPAQPFLAVAGLALLLWALVARVTKERSCPVALPREKASASRR